MLDAVPVPELRPEDTLANDDEIFCASCGQSLTRDRWRVVRRDAHEHTVFNPAGRLFTIECFAEAPGAEHHGVPSDDFTWFPGYRWTVAGCRGCGVHIGWRFETTDGFFGLIKTQLTNRKR